MPHGGLLKIPCLAASIGGRFFEALGRLLSAEMTALSIAAPLRRRTALGTGDRGAIAPGRYTPELRAYSSIG